MRNSSCKSKRWPVYPEKSLIFAYHFVHRPLTPEQRAVENAVILFSVKDKDYFGISNQYIAECYITFSDINQVSDTNEQIHLKLSRPMSLGEFQRDTNRLKQIINVDFILRLGLHSGPGVSSRRQTSERLYQKIETKNPSK